MVGMYLFVLPNQLRYKLSKLSYGSIYSQITSCPNKEPGKANSVATIYITKYAHSSVQQSPVMKIYEISLHRGNHLLVLVNGQGRFNHMVGSSIVDFIELHRLYVQVE